MMNQSQITFLKMCALEQFLQATAKAKQQLSQELFEKVGDPVVRMRRIRMIHQLCDYESQMVKKIYQFQTDDPIDLVRMSFDEEISTVINRSA